MKKFLSLVLALAMTLSLVTISAGAKDFADSDELSGEQYAEAVNVMSEMGIIDGYASGDFQPQGTLTRGAAAKIIACMMLGKTTAEALGTQAAPFKDVPAGSTFAGYIAYCVESGLIDGYADGTFRPQNTLTGFAFLKMLLTALGYDSSIEGYTGTNWTVNVAGRAQQVGLTDGNDEFVGTRAATREEACLYAVNALQATLVEYESKGTNVTVNGATVAIGASKPTFVTSSIAGAATSINDTIDNTTHDYTVEFAEKYQPDLELDSDTDAFGRPAHTWSWKGEEIGTYVDYDLMVAEYTTKVTGRDLYDVLGKAVVDDYHFDIYVDGIDDKAVDSTLFTKADINRNNRGNLDPTGNGVLTQVFVDTKAEVTTIAVINTYLAIADGDYNDNRDQATFTVYNIHEDSKGNFVKNDSQDERMAITTEDFAMAADVLDDDVYLVNVADGKIQIIGEPETLAAVEISAFSVGNHLTVDGTKYDYADTARYDVDTLDAFTTTGAQNLKDATYNVYLDAYGYMIGVNEIDPADNYVFITGMDNDYSTLASRRVQANAIFLDGTMDTITIDAVNSKNLESAWTDGNNATINSWFTYTVNSSDVYTVSLVNSPIGSGSAGQYRTGATYDEKIDDENIDLPGDDRTGNPYDYVYGNDDSVYLTVSIREIQTADNVKARVIDDVESVTVGVDNTSIEVYDQADAVANVDTPLSSTLTVSGESYGVYTLYDDDAYVIAAVVVGDDGGTSSNYVYVHSKDNSVVESYDKTTELWTWTREVLVNGQEVELKEVNDVEMSYLEDMDQYKWYRVTYNAAGEVKNVTSFQNTVGTMATNDNALMDSDFTDWYDDATSSSRLPQDHVAITDITQAPAHYGDDVIVYHHIFTNEVPSVNKARTFYVSNENNTGVRVDSEVNVVFIQTNDNRTTTEFGTGIDYLDDVIADLHEASGSTPTSPVYDYEIAMLIENARATTVIVRDTVDTYKRPVVVTNHHVTATYDGFHTFTITIDDGCTPNNIEIANAIKAELTSAKWDCTDVSVKFDGNDVSEVSFVTETGTPVTLSVDTGNLDVKFVVELTVNGKTVTVGPDTLTNVQKLSKIQSAAGASGPWAKVTNRKGITRVADINESIKEDDVKIEFGYAKLTGAGVSGALTGWNATLSGIDVNDLFKKGDTFDVTVTNGTNGVWGSAIGDFTWTTTAPTLFKVTGADLTYGGSASDPAVITLHIEVIATPTSSQQCVVTA